MAWYAVEYVVRNQRSIGKTYPMEILINADNEEHAKEIGRDAFHKLKFDTWHCQSIRLATDEELAAFKPPENI